MCPKCNPGTVWVLRQVYEDHKFSLKNIYSHHTFLTWGYISASVKCVKGALKKIKNSDRNWNFNTNIICRTYTWTPVFITQSNCLHCKMLHLTKPIIRRLLDQQLKKSCFQVFNIKIDLMTFLFFIWNVFLEKASPSYIQGKTCRSMITWRLRSGKQTIKIIM